MTWTHRQRSRLWIVPALVVLAVLGALSAGFGQASEGCTTAVLRDAYGFHISGAFIPSAVQPPDEDPDPTRIDIVVAGRMVFDGHGQLSTTFTESVGGRILPPGTATGTYSVRPDCTGSLTLENNTDHHRAPAEFVIVEHGNTILLIITDTGAAALGTATRQGGA